MVLMAYDESSPVLGSCIAMANSPLLQTMQGAMGLIEILIGVLCEKLFLFCSGIYGYNNP